MRAPVKTGARVCQKICAKKTRITTGRARPRSSRTAPRIGGSGGSGGSDGLWSGPDHGYRSGEMAALIWSPVWLGPRYSPASHRGSHTPGLYHTGDSGSDRGLLRGWSLEVSGVDGIPDFSGVTGLVGKNPRTRSSHKVRGSSQSLHQSPIPGVVPRQTVCTAVPCSVLAEVRSPGIDRSSYQSPISQSTPRRRPQS